MAGFRLGRATREEIMCLLAADRDTSWSQIARRVGCHRSTVQREVTRNGGRSNYSSHEAQQRATRSACRRRFLFDIDPGLADEVRGWLIQGYSPYAAAVFTGRVCAETIYRAVYDGRLGVTPAQVLRTRRVKRRHRHLRQPTSDGNYLGAFLTIWDRPAHIENRLEIGHWEGDLITGSKNQSAMITLIERSTRFQAVRVLPHGHSADATIAALHKWVTIHEGPLLSLTWDRGAELTRWIQLVEDYNIAVYFCDPKSPGQRASNENGNRQLRSWFTRRSDLSRYTQTDADHAAHILNTTPRRIHNNATAHDLYNKTAH